MRLRTLAELLPTLAGASSRDVENWIARLPLSTSFEKPGRGRPRLFNRANALELAFVAAFVRGGATPSSAVAIARRLVLQAQQPTWERLLRHWFIFPAGDLRRAVTSDAVDLPAIENELDAVTLTTVNLKEIVRRVDAVFAERPSRGRGVRAMRFHVDPRGPFANAAE